MDTSKENIEQMYEYDKDVYRSNRRLCEHNQYISCFMIRDYEIVDDDSYLATKYTEQFSVKIQEQVDSSRYDWIEEIENKALVDYLKQQSEERLELLTLYIMEEKTQEEIATILGISRSSVADRISRIRNNMKKVYKYHPL